MKNIDMDTLQKNPSLEASLLELELALNGSEPQLVDHPAHLCFVVGLARSGTTLMQQYLAASGRFAYPSNLISRFFMAPHVGEIVQQLLLDKYRDHQDQLGDLRSGLRPIEYASDLGKTTGALSPNEFWYFWRRYFRFEEGMVYDPYEDTNEFGVAFHTALRRWQRVAGKPILLKAATALWNLEFLARLLPESRFVVIRRNPVDAMISLLNARLRFKGDIAQWYGLTQPSTINLKAASPFESVATQVATFERLVSRQIAALSPDRVVNITYEDFCLHPFQIWRSKALAPYVDDFAWADNNYQAIRFEPKAALPLEGSPQAHSSKAFFARLYEKMTQRLEVANG